MHSPPAGKVDAPSSPSGMHEASLRLLRGWGWKGEAEEEEEEEAALEALPNGDANSREDGPCCAEACPDEADAADADPDEEGPRECRCRCANGTGLVWLECGEGGGC
jgi:hypothetical protein